MAAEGTKKTVIQLLDAAGITAGGSNDWDIQVHNDNFYRRILAEGSLGLGESYMDNWWSVRSLDTFIEKLVRADMANQVKKNPAFFWQFFLSRISNRQSRKRAFQVGVKHYDIGNDLYTRMLDSRMLYTCGYWQHADTLDKAQEDKMDLVCRKIGLKPGMQVLDLGCGYGSFAKFAAQRYGARVTGYTVSKNQAELGREMNRGLPVEIMLEDYRNAQGSYDRVVSIGIMEHVGPKNYRTYMKTVDRTLKQDGIAFIHTIGGNESKTISDPWTEKYIFPNGKVPSIAQLARAMEGFFVLEDLHNFGEDYDKTLMAWYHNFQNTWEEIKDNYGDRFYRMWTYYLLSCAGAFRARGLQLWQMVITRPGTGQPDCRLS